MATEIEYLKIEPMKEHQALPNYIYPTIVDDAEQTILYKRNLNMKRNISLCYDSESNREQQGKDIHFKTAEDKLFDANRPKCKVIIRLRSETDSESTAEQTHQSNQSIPVEGRDINMGQEAEVEAEKEELQPFAS